VVAAYRAGVPSRTVIAVTSLLLVEDDQRISVPLIQLLSGEGYSVTHVEAGAGVAALVEELQPDLLLLDLSLPDVDGLDVCRSVRQRRPALPIVLLTARNEEVDIVVGLGAGADDYVVKPFRVAELVARIKARLRLVDRDDLAGADGVGRDPSTAGAPGLRIDVAARRIWVDDEEITLSPKEFDLLAHLAARPGVTVRREDIMSEVWDEHWWGSSRTLDTHVATLRRKLGDTGDTPRFISTIRGVGLRFEVR
jgi:DNA-binding response OmpR family regulator